MPAFPHLSAALRGPSRRGSPRGARRGLLCTLAACLAACLVILSTSRRLHGMCGAKGGGEGDGAPAAAPAAAAAAEAAATEAAPKAEDWSHPLFSRVHRDLAAFTGSDQEGNITLQLVEQAYCQGSRASFRLQVVNQTAYVVGEAPSYESRLLSVKRQLLRLWLAGQLPEGLDVVIEQEDVPTVPSNRSADCPTPGPLIAPAKQPANASHAHILLAPDFSFEGWLEARTLAWEEMLPLLRQAAEQSPWESRSPLLFFRGASTGARNLTDPGLSEAYPELLDVQLVNWTNPIERTRFVPLPAHCAFKHLLHLPGNSYAGRLKYLLACGSAVVMPESGGWEEFWYHLLQDGHNIITTEEVTPFNRGHQLADVTQELQQDDWLARRLGEHAAALATDGLAPHRVQAYWRLLLLRYRELQTFNASAVHPDAVPLERSILMPQVLNVTQRTCSVCQHTPEQWEAQRLADLGLLGGEEERSALGGEQALAGLGGGSSMLEGGERAPPLGGEQAARGSGATGESVGEQDGLLLPGFSGASRRAGLPLADLKADSTSGSDVGSRADNMKMRESNVAQQ